jgi:hypothetical protein
MTVSIILVSMALVAMGFIVLLLYISGREA